MPTSARAPKKGPKFWEASSKGTVVATMLAGLARVTHLARIGSRRALPAAAAFAATAAATTTAVCAAASEPDAAPSKPAAAPPAATSSTSPLSPVWNAYRTVYDGVYDNVIAPYAEPSREKLLPDLPPNIKGREKPTLVVSLDGTLIESQWCAAGASKRRVATAHPSPLCVRVHMSQDTPIRLALCQAAGRRRVHGSALGLSPDSR